MSINQNYHEIAILQLQEMVLSQQGEGEGSVPLDERLATFISENKNTLLLQMRELDESQKTLLLQRLKSVCKKQPAVNTFVEDSRGGQDSVPKIKEVFFKNGLEKWINKHETAMPSHKREAAERVFNAWKNNETELDLSNLNLESLPVEMRCLKGLEKLDLGNNNFQSIPEEIESHSSLKVLLLEGNPLEDSFRFKKRFHAPLANQPKGPFIIGLPVGGQESQAASSSHSAYYWQRVLPRVVDCLIQNPCYFDTILYEIRQNVDCSFDLFWPILGSNDRSVEHLSEEEFLKLLLDDCASPGSLLSIFLAPEKKYLELLKNGFGDTPKLVFESTQLNNKNPDELQEIFRQLFNSDLDDNVPLSETRIDAEYRSPRHKETAIFFYPKSREVAHDSWFNKFFALNDDRLFRVLKTAQQKNVVIKLVNSVEDINTVLKNNHNISFIEIGGHGNQNSVHIGDGNSGTHGYVDEETVAGLNISNIKQNATILLCSCKTGSGETNIASKLSAAMQEKDVTVIAPKVNIEENDITRVRSNSSSSSGSHPIYMPVVSRGGADVTRCYRKGNLVKEIKLNIHVTFSNYSDLSFMDDELKSRYFDYLKECGWTKLNGETVTQGDWLENSRHNQKIIKKDVERFSRKFIVLETIKGFYKTQHLGYIVSFDPSIV
jgi:hypothetical protein